MPKIRRSRLVASLLTLALLLSVATPALAQDDADAGEHVFAKRAFAERYNALDHPEGRTVDNPAWRWGPGPLTPGMVEPYVDAPGFFREVQYFDKGRLEINDLRADRTDPWYATGGLLVLEMVEGWIQIGDNEVDETPGPAMIPIVGDTDDENALTYADIDELGLREIDAATAGDTLDMTVVDGEVVSDDRFADYDVTAVYVIEREESTHAIASVFWDFMQDTGELTLDGDGEAIQVAPSPFYLTGYPITEALWATVMVDGEERDVLWQCFERRCLTYLPDNPEGWQVESNNAGAHYVTWRYGEEGPATETVSLFLTAIGDAGERGEEFGCDDSLVPVEVEIQAHDETHLRIAAALQALFVYQPDDDSDLYNVFDPMTADLGVVAVTIFEDTAAVTLEGVLGIGGVCDEPRVEEQIRHTAMQFDEIGHMVTLYRDGALFPPQQTPDDGIVATFRVGVETFRVWVTNEETIEQIFALEAGESMANIPNGTLHYGPGEFNHNLPWGWHLDSEEIEMAEMTIELCDGNPAFVEAELDYFIESVGHYCPWAAELVSIEDYRD